MMSTSPKMIASSTDARTQHLGQTDSSVSPCIPLCNTQASFPLVTSHHFLVHPPSSSNKPIRQPCQCVSQPSLLRHLILLSTPSSLSIVPSTMPATLSIDPLSIFPSSSLVLLQPLVLSLCGSFLLTMNLLHLSKNQSTLAALTPCDAVQNPLRSSLHACSVQKHRRPCDKQLFTALTPTPAPQAQQTALGTPPLRRCSP